MQKSRFSFCKSENPLYKKITSEKDLLLIKTHALKGNYKQRYNFFCLSLYRNKAPPFVKSVGIFMTRHMNNQTNDVFC